MTTRVDGSLSMHEGFLRPGAEIWLELGVNYYWLNYRNQAVVTGWHPTHYVKFPTLLQALAYISSKGWIYAPEP